MKESGVDIVLGLDVGKTTHWGCAIISEGKKVFDASMPNTEAKLLKAFNSLSEYGRLLVVVDQPANIGALAVMVALDNGISVAYMSGLTMRRAADLYPGDSKTDKRDAFVIADTSWRMPHVLRQLEIIEEDKTALQLLTGFDQDLGAQCTQVSNRIRGLLSQVHPPLEKVIGPWLKHNSILVLLKTYPTTLAMKKAGQTKIEDVLRKAGAARAKSWAVKIMDSLNEQTVVVPGTISLRLIMPSLCEQLILLNEQRAENEKEIERLVVKDPLSQVLMSMPGVGIRTAAVFIAETTGRTFETAQQLASYAGLTPSTRRSGTSIHSEKATRSGNKRLKRAMFLSAFAALKSPESRAYYDRKRSEGKHHNTALTALAHQRIKALFAMIKNGTLYETNPKTQPTELQQAA